MPMSLASADLATGARRNIGAIERRYGRRRHHPASLVSVP